MPMSCNRINNGDKRSFENSSPSPSCKFSLSSTQQVVWLDQILRPDSTCYNLGSVVLIEGELDEAQLVRALKSVVYRHDALRLRLINTQALPLQEVTETLPVSVTSHDFSGYADPEEQAEQHIRATFRRPFDLNGELWRFELLRMGANRWYWQFCCHHLIGDAITIGLIPEELVNTYHRLIRGEELTETAPSYLDFIHEDRAYLNSPRYQQDQQFWLERYKNLPPAVIQPSNSDKTAAHDSAEPLVCQLDSALFQRIENLVTAQGLSVLHFMYAVLAGYFSRTTHRSNTDNTEEQVFGIPVHNRKNSKQKRTMGMFSSVIPVGITVAPDDSFLDVMKKSATELRRCYKRQRLPIAEINRLTQVQQKTGRAQLFDIMLSFEWIEVNARMPNATLRHAKIQRHTPFPLVIALYQYAFTDSEDAQKPVTLEFNFSPNYLNRAEVMALQARLMVLIEAALRSPQTPIRNLPILPPAERQQLLVDFNATQVDYPPAAFVHAGFEAQAAH
ncbi:condensation domain-containing protein, partial [Xenorhabdus beddingii]|uniref:condensation domain-containing protein n=1 Tax=Xenorhabdus beddingii TaxID=40578 RepID=UPI001FCA313C